VARNAPALRDMGRTGVAEIEELRLLAAQLVSEHFRGDGELSARRRVTNIAIAGIDLAEALLVPERSDEIATVAAHAFRVLKKVGILTGALMALAYLKELWRSGN
jgi:hypothetical protein